MRWGTLIALLTVTAILVAAEVLILNDVMVRVGNQPPSHTPTHGVRSNSSTRTASHTHTPATSVAGWWVDRELSRESVRAELSGTTYASLGYPVVIASPSNGVNVTYWVALGSHEVRLGYVRLGVIDLLSAWRDCVKYLREHLSMLLPNASPEQLRRVNFSLINAVFYGGRVVNDTLKQAPQWLFEVTLTWDGYRLTGLSGYGSFDVTVNALNGNVSVDWADIPRYVLPPPNYGAPKVEDLNASVARELVVNALRKYLEARNASTTLRVIEGCSLCMRVDLVLARLGPGGSFSNNALVLEGLVNSSFKGEWRLYLLANLYNTSPPGPPLTYSNATNYTCTFLVDLKSDTLVAFMCEQLYPHMPYLEVAVVPARVKASVSEAVVQRLIKVGSEYVNASVVMPDAINLSGGGSIKLLAEWVARGSLSNSSVVKLLKIYGDAAIVKAEVIWPKHVSFRVTPEEVTINSSTPKAYLTVSWGGMSVPPSSNRAWPDAIIVKVTINYVEGSKVLNRVVDYVALPTVTAP